MNQDNHDSDWGTHNDLRSGFYLSALTREGLREAMLARRSFASRDRNASLRLMADGTCWMGSVLSGYSRLSVDALAEDPDPGDGFATLEVFGPGKELLHSQPCGGALRCEAALIVAVNRPTSAGRAPRGPVGRRGNTHRGFACARFARAR
jgi:hypothetical protein